MEYFDKGWIDKYPTLRQAESFVYLDGIPDDKRQAVMDEIFRLYPTWFFEALVEFQDSPLILEPYQVAYLLDESTFKITNKGRQMGGSMQLAMAKFHRAYTTPSYRCDIISINLKEATDKIKYIRNFWDTLPPRYQLPLEIDNALSIGFHKGNQRSVINSLAASTGIRGGRKEIVFDEFAHIPKNADLFKAALPAIMNGDLTIDLVSTPMGRYNIFADIWFNEPDTTGKRPFSYFSRHEFIWFETQRFLKESTNPHAARAYWEDELHSDMEKMDELIDLFANDKLLAIRHMYPRDYFLQEFCGHFIDDSAALFSLDLINSCLRSPVGSADDQVEEYLEPWEERPENNENYLSMGVDFGQSGESDDKTSFHIVEKTKNGSILKHRYSRTLNKKQFPDFPSQAEEIVRVAKRFKVNRMNCDNTGLGLGIVPLIQKMAPEIHVDGISFTVAVKEEMVMNLKTMMEQGLVWIMSDDTLLQSEIHGMRGDATPSGRIRYHGEPHDDNFWAFALACREGVYTPFAIYTIESLLKGYPL